MEDKSIEFTPADPKAKVKKTRKSRKPKGEINLKLQVDREELGKIVKELTNDGFGLAKRVKELTNYTYEAIVYKLSHPLNKSSHIVVFNGKGASGPPGVIIFLSDKDGKITDSKPVIDKKNVNALDMIKELGYIVS